MKVTVDFTDGRSSQEFDSILDAAEAILAEYPDGVIYDAGGFGHDKDDSDDTYDVRSGRMALAWATEEESVNDDGAHAVASINAEAV